jgi:electron transfer flavoprotein-quinone oxidoreductase
MANADAKSAELLDVLIDHPSVRELVKGATPLEYSAQLIPEGGLDSVPKLYGNGLLVVGDAAGLIQNNGLLLRGMDFAVASGAAAAEVGAKAKEKGDYSAVTLSQYERMLRDSFVLRDLKTYRNAPRFLSNPRLYSTYPDLACALMEKLFAVDGSPRKNMYGFARSEAKGKASVARILGDILGARAL